MQTRPKLIVFDVNETLLDLTPLKAKVDRAMSSDAGFDLWFSKLLHYSLVETVTVTYVDFSSIAARTFKMVAKKLCKDVDDEEIGTILDTIKSLPPYADVIPALTLLKEAKFSMVALTNGNQEVAEKQLAHAKIDRFFKHIISVENVGRYKPHADAYAFVLKKTGIRPGDALMVAAHGWDIIGAERAGLRTAFIEREGKSLYPLGKSPDLSGGTILEVAQKLTAI